MILLICKRIRRGLSIRQIPGNIALTNDNGSYDTAKLYKVTDKIDSQLTYKGNIVVKAVGKVIKTVIDELEKRYGLFSGRAGRRK